MLQIIRVWLDELRTVASAASPFSIRSTSRVARAFGVGALSLLGACDAASPTRITDPVVRTPPVPSMSIAIDTSEDTWDYYSADVTIARSAGENAVGLMNAANETQFNTVRTLSNGV